MKVFKRIVWITPLLALCGCVGQIVPMTKFKGSIAGQPFEIQSPKNSELTGLEITAEGKDVYGQTNRVSIKVQALKANMDPQVITTTGDAQAKIISSAAAAGAQIAGQVAAAAAGKP